MIKKSIILFVLLSFSYRFCAQNTNESFDSIMILDSIVIFNNDANAVKLTIKLSASSIGPKAYFGFFENVFTDPYCALFYESKLESIGNCGLTCVIKDDRDNYVDVGPSHLSFVSCENFEDEIKHYDSRWFVDKNNLSIEFKYIENYEDRRSYDLAKLSVLGNDTILNVFPMIVSKDKRLSPGKYLLYLLYCQYDDSFSYLYESLCSSDETVFWGVLKSNVITLIVKDRPIRWWEFWRRKFR